MEAEDARVAAEGRAQLAEGKLALEQAALEREKEYAARLKVRATHPPLPRPLLCLTRSPAH